MKSWAKVCKIRGVNAIVRDLAEPRTRSITARLCDRGTPPFPMTVYENGWTLI